MAASDKPSVFIASSVEGLSIADAINANLEHVAHCTIWRAGTFKLSSRTIDDLVKKSSIVDFAVFAFTPDDVATIRKHEKVVARDNVVFEMGLFIGAIGKERCYIVKPRGVDMHLPSDLIGVTPADYAVDRPDGDMESALNYACKLIRDQIGELGLIRRAKGAVTSERHVANPPDYALQDSDLMFLAECVKSHVNKPVGLSFDEVGRALRQFPEYAWTMSAVKLERLGYIEKTIEHSDGEYEYDFYAFAATKDGIDVFLQYESQIAELYKPPATGYGGRPVPRPPSRPAAVPKPSSGFGGADDDSIPF